MSNFWGWFISIITVVSIVGCLWLIRWTSKKAPGEEDTTGHVWDGDLKELNNPLPRWWLWTFYLTIAFAVAYLVIYPGMGKFGGTSGWTQVGQYDQEVAVAEAKYGELFARMAATDIEALSRDQDALRAGRNLFVNNCAMCHGSDGRGARSFPDLTDGEWMYGGDPSTIQLSIMMGRNGVMPSWGPALGNDGVAQVTEHVLAMNGREHDADLAAAGADKFAMFCAACHGPDGKGNQALGAPDLTNDIWLHSGSREGIAQLITDGVNNRMPAQGEILGEDRVHVLAAYVYSLSQGGARGTKTE
jgi:cytochrome c oxidase cbb3-type subunit 3